MKIPTLLALTILSILIVLGISLKFYLDASIFSRNTRPIFQNINQSNLTPNTISINFLTTKSYNSQIVYSSNSSLLTDLKVGIDERDSQPTNRTFHFVTLTDLTASTHYFFKIKIGQTFYPNKPLEFTTPPISNNAIPSIQPLIGTVIDSNLNPVSEALVTLSVENYLSLSTYTNSLGSFVLDLKPLYKKDDLNQFINLPLDQDGLLTINQNILTSHINLHLNQLDKILPPLVLGQDLDLRDYSPKTDSASTSAQLK